MSANDNVVLPPAAAGPADLLRGEFAVARPKGIGARLQTLSNARGVDVVGGGVVVVVLAPVRQAEVDLREVEFVAAAVDSNLECPICSVPFVEPVELACDHSFCTSCFDQYLQSARPDNDVSGCPSCRTKHNGQARKATRVLRNMVDELQVRCVNKSCNVVAARGIIVRHITRDCPEESLPCPDANCDMPTKRKVLEPGKCIHIDQVQCECEDCGEIIPLGKDNWPRHLEVCSRVRPTRGEEEDTPEETIQCPGAPFGCNETFTVETIGPHAESCTFARLAPFLTQQNDLLRTTQERLTLQQIRNDELENTIERLRGLNGLMEMADANHNVPPPVPAPNNDNAQQEQGAGEGEDDVDIEEILREEDARAAEPDPIVRDPGEPIIMQLPGGRVINLARPEEGDAPVVIRVLLAFSAHHTNQILAGQEDTLNLRAEMLREIHDVNHNLAAETVRIDREMQLIHGLHQALRTQVQWLTERQQRQEQLERQQRIWEINAQIARHARRVAHGNNVNVNPNASASASTNVNENAPGQTSSGGSSAATSPNLGASRPPVRRHSGGGSQDRVKL